MSDRKPSFCASTLSKILLVLLDAIDDGEHEVVRKICLLQKKSQKKNVGTLEASSELLGCGADLVFAPHQC